MAHKLPARGNRAKTNKGKRVKAKTDPTKPKAKKTAMAGGEGMKKKKLAGAGAFFGADSNSKKKKSTLSKKTKKA